MKSKSPLWVDVVVDTAGADDTDRNAMDTFEPALHCDYCSSSQEHFLGQEYYWVNVSIDFGYR